MRRSVGDRGKRGTASSSATFLSTLTSSISGNTIPVPTSVHGDVRNVNIWVRRPDVDQSLRFVVLWDSWVGDDEVGGLAVVPSPSIGVYLFILY
jgi:hypothetical protein